MADFTQQPAATGVMVTQHRPSILNRPIMQHSQRNDGNLEAEYIAEQVRAMVAVDYAACSTPFRQPPIPDAFSTYHYLLSIVVRVPPHSDLEVS